MLAASMSNAFDYHHSRQYFGPRYVHWEKKKQPRHGLPVHRFYNAAFAPRRWNGTETALGLRYGDCRFLPNANCGEKTLSRGQNGRVGRVSRNKTFFFFFVFFVVVVFFFVFFFP